MLSVHRCHVGKPGTMDPVSGVASNVLVKLNI